MLLYSHVKDHLRWSGGKRFYRYRLGGCWAYIMVFGDEIFSYLRREDTKEISKRGWMAGWTDRRTF